MSEPQVQNFSLDMENFSKDFTELHEGIPYLQDLMKDFIKMYPSFRQTPDFIRFKDEPNLVARATMLTPDSPAEIFFVAIRQKDDKGERQDLHFSQKYYNEIIEYRKNSKEVTLNN